MKALQLPLFLLFSLLLLSSSCKKKNTEPELPPETTIGAMTFGCKVNGKVFVPKGSLDGPAITSQYIYLGTGQGGGWFLNLSGANRIDEPRITIGIETDSLFIEEGKTYRMKEAKGHSYAGLLKGLNLYYIYPADSGELIITKHNQQERILSGRFWFTATSVYDQTKMSITEGRFDVRY
jgi:hypothetical protein